MRLPCLSRSGPCFQHKPQQNLKKLYNEKHFSSMGSKWWLNGQIRASYSAHLCWPLNHHLWKNELAKHRVLFFFCCCWCAWSWDIWVTSEIPSFWVSLHRIRMPLVCNHMLTFRYLLDFSLDLSEYVCGTNKALAISPSKASSKKLKLLSFQKISTEEYESMRQ